MGSPRAVGGSIVDKIEDKKGSERHGSRSLGVREPQQTTSTRTANCRFSILYGGKRDFTVPPSKPRGKPATKSMGLALKKPPPKAGITHRKARGIQRKEL